MMLKLTKTFNGICCVAVLLMWLLLQQLPTTVVGGDAGDVGDAGGWLYLNTYTISSYRMNEEIESTPPGFYTYLYIEINV